MNDTGECFDGQSCAVPSTFCRYWRAGHQFEVRHDPRETHKRVGNPVKRALGFFQREACSHHGKWDENRRNEPGKECRCPKPKGTNDPKAVWGRYCLQKGYRIKRQRHDSTPWVLMFGIIAATIVAIISYAICFDRLGYKALGIDPDCPDFSDNDIEHAEKDRVKATKMGRSGSTASTSTRDGGETTE